MTVDASKFAVDTYEGEFEVRFDVRGTITRSIKAADMAEAQRLARAMLDVDDDDFLDLDDIDDVRLCDVARRTPMYLVTREGQKMRVSRLQEGDEPQSADESGF